MDQQPKSELMVLRDYLDAVAAVRRARSIFLVVIVSSLLVHMGVYCAARWGQRVTAKVEQVRRDSESGSLAIADVIATQMASTTPATALPTTTTKRASAPPKAPTTAAAAPQPSVTSIAGKDDPGSAEGGPRLFREDLLSILLPMARSLGLAASSLLILTYLIGVNICLGGRMGGICDATSAFFWSIVLIALLFPWRHLLPGTPIDLPDAFYDLEQIRQGLAGPFDTKLAWTLHFGRFLGCPILAVLTATVSGIRFGMAYRRVRLAVEPLVLMKVV